MPKTLAPLAGQASSAAYCTKRAYMLKTGSKSSHTHGFQLLPIVNIMSVLLEFSMFPTDKGESVSAYVSQVIKMIRDSGVDYQLTPMGTIIETATMPEALGIIEKAYSVLEAQDCNRVYSSLKFDIRKGKDNRLAGKIKSVREKIGEVNT